MGKIKKGLTIIGIIVAILLIIMIIGVIQYAQEQTSKIEESKSIDGPPSTSATASWEKFTPEEIAEWDAQIQKDRDEWRQKMEEGINQQRELEKEINAWKEKMDDTFVADVNPKISEGEWYYTKNCTEMSMAWGLMPDVLWTELEVKRAIEACIQDAKINDPDAFLP
tara:strand:+ start:267 stop:767 length:501 start_codon:yes stop_codon:yes gene_type:complete